MITCFVCISQQSNIFQIFYSDVEGWHHRLNRKCGSKCGFYDIVVKVLHREVKNMKTTLRLISEQKLSRRQGSNAKSIQSQIFTLWDRYDSGELTVNGLLNKVKDVYSSAF